MPSKIRDLCSGSEKTREGLPAITFDKPFHYWLVAEEERGARIEATADTCVIDGEAFFIRAVLEIPILREDDFLSWGVWGSLSEQNFQRYQDAFFGDDQGKLGSMFSWFASGLPEYPDTIDLKCKLLPRDGRLRPLVTFHSDQDHPLVHDQFNGITVERAIEFVALVPPPH